METELHAFSISAVGGSEWSDLSPGGFTRKGKALPPVCHSTASLVGSKSGLDFSEKINYVRAAKRTPIGSYN
jgi:hypothetical protein